MNATCLPWESVGQVSEARVGQQARAVQVDLGGLQPELLQLLREQAELLALIAAFILQVTHLGLWSGDTKYTS